jgi:hypothetical protein
MALTTTLQTKYTVQRLFLIAVCLVMGLWGVYDYAIKIPAQSRAYERGQVCLQVKQALEDASTPEERARAAATVEAQLQMLSEMVTDDLGETPGSKDAFASIKARNEEAWLARLLLFRGGLTDAERRTAGAPNTPQLQLAAEVASAGINETGDVTPPSRLDRATQWVFIACLPFVPVFAVMLMKVKRVSYTLEDDGTFIAPEGTWSKDEIEDIDMSRWMAKSVAHVVVAGGRRIKLDDYIYRNTHLIVGALASERYPDQWEPDARVRKPGEDAATDGETPAAAPNADSASEEPRAAEV